MKPHTSYLKGVKQVFQYWKLWGGLYLVNLLFALVAVMPLKWLFEKTLGSSMQIDELLQGFNFEVISDFLNTNGTFVNPLLNQSLILILLFVLLYIFLTGGMLAIFKQNPEPLKAATFWGNSGHYFWRLFRMTLYFLFIQALLLIVLGWLYMTLVQGLSSEMLGFDIVFVRGLKFILPFYFILAFIVSLVQHYAKIHLVNQENTSAFRSLIAAFRLVRRNFWNVFLLYLLNLFVFLIFFGLYWLIKQSIPGVSGNGILILFVLGQLFVLLRIGMQLINLSSGTVMYQGIPVEIVEPD